MNLSRKRKKELRKLQSQATTLWESQQVLLGQAGEVAREAGRQLGNYNREQFVPGVRQTYGIRDRNVTGVQTCALPIVIGSALSVWDAANEKRDNLAAGRAFGSVDLSALQAKAQKYGKTAAKRIAAPAPAPAKKGIGAGGVIAIILGVAAAAGVLYAAWQTLRADDELWVADDPLRAPDA